jgi:hypothetical protein
MNRKAWNAGMVLIWFVVPTVAMRYWLVWDQLPEPVATHFNAAGRPNGWMSREVSLIFILVLMLLILTLATAILSRIRKLDATSWALMGFFYVIGGVLFWGNEAVLGYNLFGRAVEPLPVIICVFVASLALVAIFIRSKRGVTLPRAGVVADEVHAGRLWAVIMAVPLVAESMAIAIIPNAGVRTALGLVGIVLLIGAALAWSGFHYVFTNSGVEIRTLGFRLRSIPALEIESYAAEPWNPFGGYGIRGIGDRRAYVWGNRGVWVKTKEGEVFLGHDQPERIVRDLDIIRNNHQGHEGTRSLDAFPS